MFPCPPFSSLWPTCTPPTGSCHGDSLAQSTTAGVGQWVCVPALSQGAPRFTSPAALKLHAHPDTPPRQQKGLCSLPWAWVMGPSLDNHCCLGSGLMPICLSQSGPILRVGGHINPMQTAELIGRGWFQKGKLGCYYKEVRGILASHLVKEQNAELVIITTTIAANTCWMLMMS